MFREEHGLNMNRELDKASSLLVGFSMGMTLDIKAYPYTYTESQCSNEHCQSHFVLPPFLEGLKNSLAMPSTNIALPRSAINFATKIWYFSPISSIDKNSISFGVDEVNSHYFGSREPGLTSHFNVTA